MPSILGPNPPFRDGEPEGPAERWRQTAWGAAESLWPQTRWGENSSLTRAQSPAALLAWRDLVDRYRRPLEQCVRRQLARRLRRPAADADVEDKVQGFLTACYEKQSLLRADPALGRFRAFVQVLLERYVSDEVDRDLAKKRGGAAGREPVDALDSVATGREPAPDEAFDREWVGVAVERAVRAVEAEHERYGLVLRDLIRTDGAGSRDLAGLLGVHPEQLAVIKTRARKLFRKRFEVELAATVRDARDLEDEWAALAPFLP